VTRRAFLAAAGLLVLAATPAWAHHKPGHQHGPAPTTTTTTTTLPPADGGYSDLYADIY
jgi:hypothetical protein